MPNGCSGCVERPTPDLNVYQSRKTLAQGMMDLALFTANAHQLRHVWETKSHQPYFYFSIVFISVSILFQIAVGIGLIWNYRYDIKNEEEIRHAYRNNNYTLLGIFMITIVNVLISVFAVQEQAPVFPESTTDCVP
ncbi:ninjurin-A-like [Drosophila albomicans]|uniref:Ninjurin-A-like n=1 Tax=Drosophila albomicans TaxID=7291 RepID=A0A6P8X355_DROAB|nr:ninjurin-A-like [Drosophila albomicans]